MAEAAQSKTLVSSALANDEGVLLNEEGGKVSDDASVKSLGDTQNCEVAEKSKDNTPVQARVVDEAPEPSIAEFWGKYGEDVDGEDDEEYEGLDFIENGVGKKVVEKGISFDDILEGAETGGGLNGRGTVGVEAPAIEKLSEPLELSGKDIDEQCRSSYGNGGPDFTEDGSSKKVHNENGISIYGNLPIEDNGEDNAGKCFSDSDPTKLLDKLRSIAKGTPVESMLELRALRSCLSAFFCYHRGKKLAFYQELLGIEGFEDQTENVSGQPVMQRCVRLSKNNLSGSRKRKRQSVSKLMKEGNNAESISAYKNALCIEGSSISSSFEVSLGVGEEQREMTLAEIIRENKKELERANNEGLDYIKEKLQKMSSMVENCEGGDMSSELKTSLEMEANELLEKISTIAAKPSSS